MIQKNFGLVKGSSSLNFWKSKQFSHKSLFVLQSESAYTIRSDSSLCTSCQSDGVPQYFDTLLTTDFYLIFNLSEVPTESVRNHNRDISRKSCSRARMIGHWNSFILPKIQAPQLSSENHLLFQLIPPLCLANPPQKG